MYTPSLFSSDYARARDKFLAGCEASGAIVETYPHPKPGPDGAPLYLDAARLGAREAKNILVTISGTHGPEGFCGSACQSGWLNDAGAHTALNDVALLFIHAHNPFGFAWSVRQTHEKIDLNRNFVNHDTPPKNTLYRKFQARLGGLPDHWSDSFLNHYKRVIDEMETENGKDELARALGFGQYEDVKGIHYGGHEQSWSRKTLSRILQDHAAQAQRVALIDIHTGLGRYGYGELLSVDAPDSEEFKLSRKVFGETVRSMPGGDAAATYSAGNVSEWARSFLSRPVVVAHALEFGTYEGPDLLSAKLRCHWLLAKDKLDTHEAPQILKAYRDIFYPEKDDWKELVWLRASMVYRQALSWLANAE